MTEPVYIARCPEHGLHGERTECFVCGGPVEQVPMIPVEGLTDEMVERAARAIEFDSKLSYESTARAALLAAGPWTGKLDREKVEELIRTHLGIPEDDLAVIRFVDALIAMQGGDAR